MIPFRSSPIKRTVWSIAEGKIYTNVQIPVSYDNRYSGSSHGWLAIAHENFAITLLNPFRKAEAIHLPPLVTPHDLNFEYQKHRDEFKKRYHYYIRKVILSADPSLNPDNYVVVAIYDNRGRNEIYAVGVEGLIVSVDISVPQPKAILRSPLRRMVHPVFPYGADKAYLVESSNGELLNVRRFLKPKEGVDQKLGAVNFVVYKVLFSDKDGKVVKQDVVDNIGDDA